MTAPRLQILSSNARRVMVVEEDFTRSQLLTSMLALCDVEVVATSLHDAVAAAEAGTLDAVFLNLNATRGSGVELVRRLRKQHPDVSLTSIGSDLHPDLHMAAVRLGVRSFLSVPFGIESVASTLRDSLTATENAA